MDNNNKKMFLEVDASQIQLGKLLKKDFLELSMKAISSANPNRNNSWFTRESMEKSIGTFVDKPILGYFENGDFVSHNGDWQYDSETGEDYWDTLGKKGERILGFIRQSDEVKIVEDENGLSWVTFTCALWTQYCFKQAKRLIKDAINAQKNGGSAKNISVEVDITDYEILDNGVMKINAFNLVGVTILGSRNGVKVEPGIENAELSVVDVMSRELYSAQQKSLRLAYEKELNGSVEEKEDSQVNTNEEILQNESLEASNNVDSVDNTEQNVSTENFEDDNKGNLCPECGKNPCECDKEKVEHNADCEDCRGDNKDEDNHDVHDGDSKKDNKDENREDESKVCQNLQEDNSESSDSLDYSKKDEEDKDESKKEDKKDDEKEKLSQSLASTTVLLEETRKNLEELHEKYENLKKDYETILNEKVELLKSLEEKKKKVADYEHKDFLKEAYELIDSADLDEKVSKEFREKCEKSEISNIKDLKVEVAVAAFDAKKDSDKETNAGVKATISFSAPLTAPDTQSIFVDKKVSEKKIDRWSKLNDYLDK